MILGRGNEDLSCTKGHESWDEGFERREEIGHRELESGGGRGSGKGIQMHSQVSAKGDLVH